jgi:hypothetical protein
VLSNTLTILSLGEKITDISKRSFTFYLNSITVTPWIQSVPLYGVWDYIYEIGGWIGLFLGYSVVSAFDEIVNIILIIRYKVKSLF